MREPVIPRIDVNPEAMHRLGEALSEVVRALQRMTFPEMPVLATWHAPADYDALYALYARLAERPVDRARRLRIERWQRHRARHAHRKAPR